MSRAISVVKLAKEAKEDLDYVFITLREAGFRELKSPNDTIPAKRVAEARATLHVDDPQAQKKVVYWLSKWQTTREEFNEILLEMGITLSKEARVLPKGALKKLNRRDRSFDKPKVAITKAITDPPKNPVTKKKPNIARDQRKEVELPIFKWRTIGTDSKIRYLTLEDVIAVHDALVENFSEDSDPISPPGLRDINLLISAIERPKTNHLKYPTVEMAGAALVHSIVLNHAFYNGNKRTGLVSLLVFMDKNLLWPECSKKQLFDLMLDITHHMHVPRDCDSSDDREVFKIAERIVKYFRPTRKEEWPIAWIKLKRILKSFDCEMELAVGVGNRINLSRYDERSRFRKLLKAQVAYGGDGTEAAVNTVHHIRKKLKLDEANGYDSKTFYEAASRPDNFIQDYRTLLRRLARL